MPRNWFHGPEGWSCTDWPRVPNQFCAPSVPLRSRPPSTREHLSRRLEWWSPLQQQQHFSSTLQIAKEKIGLDFNFMSNIFCLLIGEGVKYAKLHRLEICKMTNWVKYSIIFFIFVTEVKELNQQFTMIKRNFQKHTCSEITKK